MNWRKKFFQIRGQKGYLPDTCQNSLSFHELFPKRGKSLLDR